MHRSLVKTHTNRKTKYWMQSKFQSFKFWCYSYYGRCTVIRSSYWKKFYQGSHKGCIGFDTISLKICQLLNCKLHCVTYCYPTVTMGEGDGAKGEGGEWGQWWKLPSHLLSFRLSKKSFVGFHMARDDLLRLRRSRSAASRPKKARSTRQEVDL